VHLAGPRQIASKQTAVDLVTEADLASERLITDARCPPCRGMLQSFWRDEWS
jgi:hypothetical protein